MRKVSIAARRALQRQAVALRRPDTVVLLGILGSYEADVLDALEELFGANVLANIGLPRETVLEAIGKAAYNYRMGYFTRNPAAELSLRDVIANGMGLKTAAQRSSVLKLLKFMEDIKASNYPVLNTYLSPQKITASTYIDAAKQSVSKTASSIAEGAADTLKESLALAAKGVSSASDELAKNLPWYLNPKLLLPAGLAGLLLFYGLPLLRMMPKRARPIEYKTNPIPAHEARRAEARRLYKTFNDRETKKTFKIPKIETSDLVELGKGLDIGYRSTKWTGKPENYLHEFGKGVRLMSTADGKHLVLAGGKLKVTDRGIVG